MSNKTYDTLKFIALVVLPAIGTLYFALAGVWGLPYGEQIVGTITAIDTFLGAIIKYFSDTYTDELTDEEALLYDDVVEDEILEEESDL